MEQSMGIMICVLVLTAGLAAAAGVVVWAVRRKARRLSREIFGTDSLMEGFKKQEEQMESTPKSVAGMTNLYLPKIEKDFPEFSYGELKRKSENLLTECLHAVESRSVELMPDASEDLKDQIRLWIEKNRAQGIREQFHGISIHQTDITGYRKKAGYCMVVLQTSLEYRYSCRAEGEMSETGAAEAERVQTRYNQEWMYVQDVSKLPEGLRQLSCNCPNCGAPVGRLGDKFCEYCGSALILINLRAWSLNRIEEVR